MFLRILSNAHIDQPHPRIKRDPFELFPKPFRIILWIKDQRIFELEARTPVSTRFHSQKSAFERVDSFDIVTAFEPHDQEHRLSGARSGCDCPPQNSLD